VPALEGAAVGKDATLRETLKAHRSQALLLAGGTRRPRRSGRHGAQPATNLFVGRAHRLGLPKLERFGVSPGRWRTSGPGAPRPHAVKKSLAP
jgi:hypothetical protein